MPDPTYPKRLRADAESSHDRRLLSHVPAGEVPIDARSCIGLGFAGIDRRGNIISPGGRVSNHVLAAIARELGKTRYISGQGLDRGSRVLLVRDGEAVTLC